MATLCEFAVCNLQAKFHVLIALVTASFVFLSRVNVTTTSESVSTRMVVELRCGCIEGLCIEHLLSWSAPTMLLEYHIPKLKNRSFRGLHWRCEGLVR